MLVNIILHDIYFHFTPSFNIFHVLKNSRYDKTFVKTKLDEFFIIKKARKIKKEGMRQIKSSHTSRVL